jgi:hypothetical protein
MMQVNAPKRYVPLRVLGVLLRWRWLAKQLNMSAEMLHFLRTEPLDTTLTDALRQRQGLMQPNLQQAVQHTALGLGGDRAINL